MSATYFLKALRATQLEKYYPKLVINGFKNIETLAKFTEDDCEKIGFKTDEEKAQLLSLAKEAVIIVRDHPEVLTKKRSLTPDNSSSSTVTSPRPHKKAATSSNVNTIEKPKESPAGSRFKQQTPINNATTNSNPVALHPKVVSTEITTTAAAPIITPTPETATTKATKSVTHRPILEESTNLGSTASKTKSAVVPSYIQEESQAPEIAVTKATTKEPEIFSLKSRTSETRISNIPESEAAPSSQQENIEQEEHNELSPQPSMLPSSTLPSSSQPIRPVLGNLNDDDQEENQYSVPAPSKSSSTYAEKRQPEPSNPPSLSTTHRELNTSLSWNESTSHTVHSPPRSNPSRRFTMHASPATFNNTTKTNNKITTTKSTTQPSDYTKQQRRMTTSAAPIFKDSFDKTVSFISSSQPTSLPSYETKRLSQKKSGLLGPYGVPSKPKETERTNWEDPLDKNSTFNQRIRACVRKRPLNEKEKALHEVDITSIYGTNTIHVNAPKARIDLSQYTEEYPFTFDDTFDCHATTKEVYDRTAKPLVSYMFRGGKATCFAYGQTGSGKTYTMLHPKDGLYVQAAKDVFYLLKQDKYAHLSVYIAFYEIYQNQIYDLLNNKLRLQARADKNNNVVISGLKEVRVQSVHDMMKTFEEGTNGRTTGRTGANNTSSRSHAILQIMLKDESQKKKRNHGKFSFIDLAGSERGQDRGETDQKTKMEGAEINKSLLALKECIRALDQSNKHKPFRGSKLTHVLRDSFIGNSRTCMIANISPNVSNSEHTLNTLRYADRLRELKGESDPRLLNSQGGDSSHLDPLPDHKKQPKSKYEDEAKTEDEEDIQSDVMEIIEEYEEDEVSEKYIMEKGQAGFLAMHLSHLNKIESILSLQRKQHQEYTSNQTNQTQEDYIRLLHGLKKAHWDLNAAADDLSKRFQYEINKNEFNNNNNNIYKKK